ncbi:recombination protein NinG [Solimonas marina]|uniref:NinG protein n=1 Tax=Solimonas marina TaxID=2714601 RepID=A0A969W8N6_9GAMM|nr:recombination protein NinG [Solimonas marina]NKF21559.1 ninG protein [Solimonas marina]
MKAAKIRKCRNCGTPFEPRSSMQIACKPACALDLVREKAQKVEARARKAALKAVRAENRAAKERLRTRRDWIKRVQVVFNRFIRLRDQHQPCICCGRPLGGGALTGGGYDAGHYRSVGSAPHLRFEEMNVHAQRKDCNQFGAGRAVDYRRGLIARIGVAEVERIERDETPRKYTIDDLKALEATYKQKVRELQRGGRHGPHG